MSDCIFCKIISGEIPSRKIYEDDNVFAFLDIQPVSRGHLLVIPKEHCADLAALSEQLVAPLFSTARRLGVAAVTATQATGFNVIMNNGSVAGQLVFHAHVHVIPRFQADGLTAWPKITLSSEEMDDIAAKIRM